jgi:hypothetical protein
LEIQIMLFECIDELAARELKGFTLTWVHRLSGPSNRVIKIRTEAHYESAVSESYARVMVLNDHFEWMPLLSEPAMVWHRRVLPTAITHDSIVGELGHVVARLVERAGHVLY